MHSQVCNLLFQELAEEDKNGMIKKYTAVAELGNKNLTENQLGFPMSMRIGRVPCKGNFPVRVSASTDAGRSPSTILTVPKWNPGKTKTNMLTPFMRYVVCFVV